MIIMVCPYCKKEKTLERQGSDPTLFGCVNCHSVYSETFLLGYVHGWVDRGVADEPGEVYDTCDHEWVDATNEVVKGGRVCTKCYAISPTT